MAILINLILTAGLAGALAAASRLLGPRAAMGTDGNMPYETGMPPIESALSRMTVLYIRFAVLFVIFDVDLAFLLPWVLNRAKLSLELMLGMTAFVALVGLMLAYVWRKGALECN